MSGKVEFKTPSGGSVGLSFEDTATDDVLELPAGNGDLYGQQNILGTVSQTAGVPTGAIIERGSNANGEYVKYADGSVVIELPNAVMTFSAATLLTVTLTIPITLVDEEYRVSVVSNANSGINLSAGKRNGLFAVNRSSTSSVILRLTTDGGLVSGDELGVSSFIVGRWY